MNYPGATVQRRQTYIHTHATTRILSGAIQKTSHVKLLPLLALLLLFGYTDSFADCHFNRGNNPLTAAEVLLKGPGIISIPADLEHDRTVYESSYIARETNNITCDSITPIGLIPNPALGPAPASGYIFPIKNSGIALQMFSSYDDPKYTINVFGDRTHRPTNVGSAYGVRFIYRFVKIGTIKHGSVIGPFTVGTINYGTLVTHNVTMTGSLIISASSCKTPDVSVNMGDYVASEVTGSRGQTHPVNFDIALNACPQGIDKVTYSLQANTPVIDRENGLVALDGASGAKGVGLRIMDGDGTPLALDKAHVFSAYDVQGGDFKIPLSAAYIRLEGQELGFGTANTSMTFTMSYL